MLRKIVRTTSSRKPLVISYFRSNADNAAPIKCSILIIFVIEQMKFKWLK